MVSPVELERSVSEWRPDAHGHGNGTAVEVITERDPLRQLVSALAVRASGGIPLIVGGGRSAGFSGAVVDYISGAPGTPPEPSADDAPAWATMSSGSTGNPRVLVRSERSWSESFAAVTDLLRLTAADSVLLPAPLSSSLSLFGAVHAIAVGATVQLPTANSITAVDLTWATAVHCTPHALRTLLDLIDDGTEHRIRVVLVGGAALDVALRRRAVRHGIEVIAYYGAAELSFVAIDVDGMGMAPFPGVELQDRGGELWVRSGFVAIGYLGSARGGLRRAAGGWATVGDRVARVEGSTRFRFAGRADDAILTAAATVVPFDVECALTAVPGVRDAVVIGVPNSTIGELVAAIVEFEPDCDPAIVSRLRESVTGALSASHVPRLWFRTERLPRTPAGKIARAAAVGAIAAWNAATPAERHNSTDIGTDELRMVRIA